jgi:hypothetical protein
MTIFYSPSTSGFYDTAIHGERVLHEADPATTEGEEPSLIEVPNSDCTIPMDAIEISPQEYESLMAAQAAGMAITAGTEGAPVAAPPAPPSADEVDRQLRQAVQRHLDAQAQAMGYDSISTASTYADEPAVAQFQAEGRALRAWRSNVWHASDVVLTAVAAGERPAPTAQELIALLPLFVL